MYGYAGWMLPHMK